jgi:general secretion pathway protein D
VKETGNRNAQSKKTKTLRHLNTQIHFFLFLLIVSIVIGAGCAGQKQAVKKDHAAAETAPVEELSAPEIGEGMPAPLVKDTDQETIAPPKIEEQQIKPAAPSRPYALNEDSEDIPEPDSRYAEIETRPKSGRTGFRPASPSQPGDIVLNFDNADLYEVIRAMAELLNINYITDPNIHGNVTIHTAGRLRKDDLFPVFFQILEANGLTAIREGSLYKIVSLKEASRLPIASRFGRSGEALPPEERVIIQIIPLKFISAQEITKLLTPFISTEGSIISHEDSNTLVLVDKAVNIAKALKLVSVFDINMFEKVNHRIWHLEYTEAQEMQETLTDIMASYGAAAQNAVKFIAIERLNILIAVSSASYIFDRVEQVIRQLDVPGNDAEPRIYVYSVKNGEAKELSELLNNVFSRTVSSSKEKETAKKEQPQKEDAKDEKPATLKTPFGEITSSKQVKTERAGSLSQVHSSGTLKGEVKITADEVRNALIVEAIPKDYQTIEEILKRLDVLPRQVLIEVTIAEISLDKKTELGVEWSYVKGSGNRPDTSTLEANIGIAGLKYVIGQTKRWEAAISALASDKKINILSSPSILASDNKEAKINISTEVPVASATYNKDDSDIIETNIQYRNTGVILSVTPHINEFGLVSMDLNQEVSNQLENNVQVGTSSMPSFFKRSVTTSLTVMHGQTIVIGGLIEQTENKGFSGVPCLGGVPVMQYLFGKKSDSVDKKELILLITPRVISNLEDVDTITEEFKNKVGHLLKSQ